MLRRALALLQSPPAYLGAAAFVAILSTIFAILFGYLSPDSWFYILIAENLRQGHGCGLHGAYLGVYPCGYPAVLALTAPAAGHAAFMVSSKITNLLLLTGSFVFIWKASRNILVPTALVFNPITLLIAMYTWSENLELFCICGTIYALSRLNEEGYGRRDQVLLAGILILGCLTRYFFGPFAFLLFVATWATHGRAVAWRALPAFAAAAVAYLAYQGVNLTMTGYPTGMPRAAAPEAPWYLVRIFFETVRDNGWNVLVPLALLLGLAWPLTSWSRARPAPGRHAAAMLILYAGLAFAGLAFVLRLHNLFDPFDVRTIGFGIVFVLAGLVGRFVRLKDDMKWPAWAVLAAGLFSAVYADDGSIPDDLGTIADGGWIFVTAHVPDLLYHGPRPQAMVTFDIPPVSDMYGNVETTRQLYYGNGITLISAALKPDMPADTPKAFLAKVSLFKDKPCYFDFTAFKSMGAFQAYLGGTTETDESFTLGGSPAVTSTPDWDPALQRYLLAVVQPGKLVPCAYILNLPVTQAALAGQTETPAQAEKALRIFLNH